MKRALSGFALTTILVMLAACTSQPTPTTIPQTTPTQVIITAVTTRVPATPAALAVGSPTTASSTRPAPTNTPVLHRGGDYKELLGTDAVSFQIYQTTDPSSRVYQDKVYASGLWLRDPQTLQPIPGMAESWTVSPDGKTYTFNLRKDIKWSDGTPLTANDFEWTYVQASKPENKYPYIDTFKDIATYTATDDYVLQIGLKDSTCIGLTTVDAITPLPKHIWSKYDWSDPNKNPEILNPTVVSGPYKLKEWRRDDHATFVRNDLYYRGAPNFDSDTVRIVANSVTQLALLKSGDADTAAVGLSDYADAKKTDNLQVYSWDPAMPEWDYIGFNLRRPLLKDVEVRHALSYAIPRQTMADQIFNGLAKPTFSAFAPSSWVFNPDVPRYDYNIDTAKATLQKAGYKLDANGKLLDKDGKPVVKLKILYNTGNPQRQQIATTAQQEFKKLGIDADLTGMEFQAYLDYLKREPFDYDLFVLGWRTTLEPYFSYQIWSEANIPALNTGAYVNKEVGNLFDQANHPPCGDNSRKSVFQQIQKIISTDAPYIFLTYRTGYTFLNKRVTPNAPTQLGISYFPEQWYINK